MRFSRIMVGLAAATALALTSTAANAANADKGQWDSTLTDVICGSGTNSRTCTYDLYSQACTEASTLGVTVAPCEFYLHATVTVVPILSGAGQVIGCTSQALSARGNGSYDSSFPQFDNPGMNDTFLFEVKDMFNDSKPGVVKYTVVDGGGQEGGTQVWTAKGVGVGSCAVNVDQGSFGGAGSVTVAV